jgi:predicted transposase YbfD/YdcC
VDALNTQTTIGKQIIDAQADYIMAVKGNQGTLFEDLKLLFEGFETEMYEAVDYDTARSTTQAHGREEYRQVWVVTDPDYHHYLRQNKKWANLHSLIKLVSVRYQPDKDKMETNTRYFISSWQANANEFLQAIRDHWQLENGLHWVLDVAFREDESRIRKNHAPANMALLRHIAVNLLKQEQTARLGISNKRKRAGWDNNYLENVVCH